MDLITLAFTFLIQHPEMAAAGAQHLSRPGAVDVVAMQRSFADLSRGVLHCYHRTARFQVADVVQKPWSRQHQYGADNSAVIQIRYFGVSGSAYQMVIAVLAKEKQIRTAVLADTAVIPYNKRCQLEEWSG